MSVPVRHPAKFSDAILSEIGLLIDEYSIKGLAVDPFAGVGKVYVLESPSLKVVGVEIESEWASQHESTVCGDSLELAELFDGQAVSAIITSPTYASRMADQYKGDPKGSVRHTYRIYLGRDLSENNSGRMQWGAKYREFHEKAWAECVKVLREGMKTYGEDGGWMILNISDHIRKSKVMPVVQWHVDTLIELGFEIVEQRKVLTPRQRHGANGEKRVSGERVIVAKLVA